MVPFSLDLDNIFNSNLDKESEKGYEIMRQMANMKDVPLPSAAAPKLDLKTAAIGSILAGILGNAEGAGSFLQGMLQGNELKRQQMDQESARQFQMQKMAQDRELGIMKTEAEIANQKANRLLSRQEQFQRRVEDQRKERDYLARQAAIDRRAAEEDLGNARTIDQFERAVGRSLRAGVKLDPETIAEYRKQVEGRIKSERQQKVFGAEMPRLRAIVADQDADPQTRQWNAALLVNMLRENPDSAIYLGSDPMASEALIQEIMADSKRATLANKTGQWRLNNLIKEGRLKDAELLHKNMKNDILKIEKSFAPEAFKLENEAKKVRIAQIKSGMNIAKQRLALDKQKFAEELKGSGIKGRNLLTATAELNAWSKAQNGIIEATNEFNEAEEMISYWKSVGKKVGTGSFRDVTSEEVERSIMFYEAQKRIAQGKMTDAENQKTAAITKIEALKSEIPAQTATPTAKPKKGATQQYMGATYVFDGTRWVRK